MSCVFVVRCCHCNLPCPQDDIPCHHITPHHHPQTALLGNEEQIRQQLASIEKCKEIRNVALADGEMSIAEEQFYIKAQLLERLVELVRDKFRIIGQTDDENKMFSKVCAVQETGVGEVR